MASIAACPRCTSNLKIPIGSSSESELRCPVCGAEFLVSEAPLQALPEATMIASRPKPTPQPISQPEVTEPKVEKPKSTASATPGPSAADQADQPSAIGPELPTKEKRKDTKRKAAAHDPLASLRAKLNAKPTEKPSATLSSFLNDQTEQTTAPPIEPPHHVQEQRPSERQAPEPTPAKQVDPLLSLIPTKPKAEKPTAKEPNAARQEQVQPQPANQETAASKKSQPTSRTQSPSRPTDQAAPSLEEILSSWSTTQKEIPPNLQTVEPSSGVEPGGSAEPDRSVVARKEPRNASSKPNVVTENATKQTAAMPSFDDLLLGKRSTRQSETPPQQPVASDPPQPPTDFERSLAETISSLNAETPATSDRDSASRSEPVRPDATPDKTNPSPTADRWVNDLLGRTDPPATTAIDRTEPNPSEPFAADTAAADTTVRTDSQAASYEHPLSDAPASNAPKGDAAESYLAEPVDFSYGVTSGFTTTVAPGVGTRGSTANDSTVPPTATAYEPASLDSVPRETAPPERLDLEVRGRLEKPPQRRSSAKIAAGTLSACLLAAYGLLWAAPQADLLRMGDWAPQAILPAALHGNDADTMLAENNLTPQPGDASADESTQETAPLIPGAAELLADHNDRPAQPLPPRVVLPRETPLRSDPAVAPASATEPLTGQTQPAQTQPQGPVRLIATRNDDLKTLLRNPRTIPPTTLAETLARAQNSSAEFLSLSLTDRPSIARKGQAYMTLAILAEQVALLDPSDPAADYGSLLAECRAVFKSVMVSPENRNDLAQIAARWNEHHKRSNSGIVMVGTVKAITPAGGTLAQYNLEVDWVTDRAIIPVLMPRLQYTTGDRVGVTGLVVDGPQQHLAGYEGTEPQVVVADYTFTPAQGE